MAWRTEWPGWEGATASRSLGWWPLVDSQPESGDPHRQLRAEFCQQPEPGRGPRTRTRSRAGPALGGRPARPRAGTGGRVQNCCPTRLWGNKWVSFYTTECAVTCQVAVDDWLTRRARKGSALGRGWPGLRGTSGPGMAEGLWLVPQGQEEPATGEPRMEAAQREAGSGPEGLPSPAPVGAPRPQRLHPPARRRGRCWPAGPEPARRPHGEPGPAWGARQP